ncbi:Zinc finger protein 91 [Dufourea novaeangliae]|uniref:Zinc finger protein 91 n=1 Tax=Dufourea novaeangliae TaxID=178035 RepID=A0A154PP78_DUFNO|nr:Zinc finger protein 91 [Dufourea novaeangliae]
MPPVIVSASRSSECSASACLRVSGFHILPLPVGQSLISRGRSGTIGKRGMETGRTVKRRSLKMNPSDKKKPFQCQKCGRGFTLKRNKDRHVNYECGHEPRFQCPYCGLRSKQTSPVYAHIRKKHPEEEAFDNEGNSRGEAASGQGGEAGSLSRSLPNYYAQARARNAYSKGGNGGGGGGGGGSFADCFRKPFGCPKCGRCFTVKGNMTRHLKYECGQAPRFQCPYCEFRSKQTSNVMSHIRTRHTGQRVYVVHLKSDDAGLTDEHGGAWRGCCQGPGTSPEDTVLLSKVFVRVHVKEQPEPALQVRVRTRATVQVSLLRAKEQANVPDLLSHSKETSPAESICGSPEDDIKRIKLETDLENLCSVVLEESNDYDCDEDDEDEDEKPLNARRRRSNTLRDIERHTCSRCSKSYIHAWHLKRHTKFECGQEPKVQCPYCEARMKQRGHVYRHIRQCHRGDRHTCPWCGRSFARSSSLRLHRRMACGKPPQFFCTICDYKSNFKGNLKRHTLRFQAIEKNNPKYTKPCPPVPDRQATAARLSTLRANVLMGVESPEASEDGLRYGHVRDPLLLPVLPLQIEDRGVVPQASALGAQHQVGPSLNCWVWIIESLGQTIFDTDHGDPPLNFYETKGANQFGTLDAFQGCVAMLPVTVKEEDASHQGDEMLVDNFEDDGDEYFEHAYDPKNFVDGDRLEGREEYKYTCFRCLKTYKRKGNLVEHQKIFCGKDKEQCCPFCEFRSPKTPMKCPQCGRTYKMKRNLTTHMKFECGGQRHFACHMCPASYTQNIGLRRHLLKRHNVYLPPKFSVPKRLYESYPFDAPSAMKTMLPSISRYVPEDREFQCSNCGRRYSLKHNLIRHERYECGGQRRFTCAFCSKKYTQNGTLQKHLLRFHNIVQYPRRKFKRQPKSRNRLANFEN